MISIEYLMTSLVVVLIPGSGVLYTVAMGLLLGKRSSCLAALGCTLGIIPSLLSSVLGLSILFHTSAIAFQIIKYIGVIYLLYLAWIMWQSSSPLAIENKKQETTYSKIIIRGFLLNILNPKLSIFFLAFLPQFISSSSIQPTIDMLVLGVIFMLITLVVFIIYGILAGYFSNMLIRSKKASITIQKLFSGAFATLSLKLALTEQT